MVLGDVRATRNMHDSTTQIAGAMRFDPDNPVEDARKRKVPKDAWIALYCA